LASRFDVAEADDAHVRATLQAGDFDGHWPGQTELEASAALTADTVQFSATARNAGSEDVPMGIGWHPYFRLPSGRREQVRLHVPARSRALVNNYDDVFPTGEIAAVAGSEYDFTARSGAPLGSSYFDDTFVDLAKTPEGHAVIEVVDPAVHCGIRLTALSPHVKAIQIYAPQAESFVAIEPQFNLTDPFSKVWAPGVDTGMVVLKPGECVTWAVRLELFYAGA
jgi:aldose 1-epimerase